MHSSRYIRFVGGPWHNRVECIELVPTVAIKTHPGVQAGITIIYKPELYHLASFVTPKGTKYYQYIHSSLILDGVTLDCCCTEKLRPWKIKSRELYFKLRRAVK